MFGRVVLIFIAAIFAVIHFATRPAQAEEPYCTQWRGFAAGASNITMNEWWSFKLAKYCPDQPVQTAATIPGMSGFTDGSPEWIAWCRAEYKTWDEATQTVIRRVSKGQRVRCPG